MRGLLLQGLVSLALPLLLAAAPAPDPVRDHIIADASAQSPAALKFERTTTSVASGGGTTEHKLRVERWDGRTWTLVGINGRTPTEAEVREARKAAGTQVPGYYNFAALLAGATERRTDADGRTVYQIAQLPPGSVTNGSTDLSSHLAGEATVATGSNGRPWIQRLRITAREAFKLSWLLKVKKFEQVSEYRLEPAGPRLASQTFDSSGSLLGIPGGEKGQVSFAYR